MIDDGVVEDGLRGLKVWIRREARDLIRIYILGRSIYDIQSRIIRNRDQRFWKFYITKLFQ